MLLRALEIMITLIDPKSLTETKKGFILSFADLFKGLIIGFIVGIVVSYLAGQGIVNIPFLSPG